MWLIGRPTSVASRSNCFSACGLKRRMRQVASEQHDGELGRGLEIDQVAVEAVELGVAIGHLLVDGGQLFVGRLQLFLGRFQLFVDALQLFVGGLDFFVGRLELLVGRFVLFLDGLQIVARLGELGLEFGDAARLVFAGRRVAARAAAARCRRACALPVSASSNKIRKQRSRRFFSGMTSRFTVRVLPFCSTRTFSLRTVLFSFFALLMAARSGSIKPSRAIFSTSKLALPVGGSRYAPVGPRNCRICSSALMSTPGGANWLTVTRSASRWALSSARKPSGALSRLRIGRGAQWPGCGARSRVAFDRQMKRRRRRGFPGIDLVLLVHRLEQVGEAADGFRGAQKQKSLRLERVMERGERLLLQARLEINQQVAATDEVHARERRVADEVLPGEDDHLAQRLADPVAAFLLDEEPPQAFRRDILARGSWRKGRGGPCPAARR